MLIRGTRDAAGRARAWAGICLLGDAGLARGGGKGESTAYVASVRACGATWGLQRLDMFALRTAYCALKTSSFVGAV